MIYLVYRHIGIQTCIIVKLIKSLISCSWQLSVGINYFLNYSTVPGVRHTQQHTVSSRETVAAGCCCCDSAQCESHSTVLCCRCTRPDSGSMHLVQHSLHNN